MTVIHKKIVPVGWGTTAQRNGATGKDGLVFSDIDNHNLYLYNKSTGIWIEIASTDVENIYVRALWYQSINAASGGAGAIGLPTGVGTAEFVFDTWPEEIDAVLSQEGADGRPTWEAVWGSGVQIYVPASGGLESNGAYTLSGTPDNFPVDFIYCYRCKLIDLDEQYTLTGFAVEKGLEIGDLIQTAGQVTITDNGDGTLTFSIPDPTIIGSVLELNSDNNYYPQVQVQAHSNTADSAGYMMFRRSRGTGASKSSIQAGDTLGTFGSQGYDSGTYYNGPLFRFVARGAQVGGYIPGDQVFTTFNSAGTWNDLLTLDGEKDQVAINGSISATTAYLDNIQANTVSGLTIRDSDSDALIHVDSNNIGYFGQNTFGNNAQGWHYLKEGTTPSDSPSGAVGFGAATYSANRNFLYTMPEDGVASGLLSPIIMEDVILTCNPLSGKKFNGDDALQQALDWLAPYRISPNATVTIELDDGVYGASSPLSVINLTHPDIARVLIHGNTTTAISFSIAGATSAPDTSNNYIYIPAGSYSTTDFIKGGNYKNFIVYVVSSTGNDGCYRVTAADIVGTDIRLTMEAGTVKNATKDGTLYLLPANNCQLVFSSTENGIIHQSKGVATIKGVYLYGNASSGYTTGFNTTIPGSKFLVDRCLIDKFWAGVYVADQGAFTAVGNAYNKTVVSMGFTYGFYANNSGVLSVNYAITSGGTYGLFTNDANASAQNMVVARHTNGMYTNFGKITAYSARIYSCTTGLVASNPGGIRQGSAVYWGNTADRSPAGAIPQVSSYGGWMV